MNWSEAGALTIFTLLFAVIAAPNAGEIDIPLLVSTPNVDQGCEKLVKESCKDDGDSFLEQRGCHATLRLPSDRKSNDKKTSELFSNTQNLLNLHLTTSMEYLLLGSKFNQWNSYRPGFQKYFDTLSNDAWNDAVALIHHMTKRGYVPKVSINKPFDEENVQGYSELEAFAVSLDKEQALATKTMNIMSEAHSETHDPEMFHYLAEHLSDVRTKKIKTVANHVNTLYNAVKNVGNEARRDSLLALHIYDTQVLLK